VPGTGTQGWMRHVEPASWFYELGDSGHVNGNYGTE
jgi:hypothetical protein